MVKKTSHDVNIEPTANVVLHIHKNKHVFVYLQINEILNRLAPQKFD
jgi:hypothetical protein